MGPKTNTDIVTIAPITIEVLIISGNLVQPPLGSINIPIVEASRNESPIKRAINICDHRLLIPTKLTISHNPAPKVPNGISKKALHCNNICNNVFIVSPVRLWRKVINQEIVVDVNLKDFRKTIKII
jgi:hypothetical protein